MDVIETQLTSSHRHNPSLDGLRGVAILMVLGVHFLAMSHGHGFLFTVAAGVIRSGWCGVDLFFVLSGFLITQILLETKGSSHYFRSFYIRRTLRIFPLYYLFILALLCLAFAGLAPQRFGIPDNPKTYLPVLGYATNLVVPFWGNARFGCLFGFWSLAVEEHFYLLWPLMVYLLPAPSQYWVCILLIFVACLTRAACLWYGMLPIAIYSLTFCRMDSLVAGCAMAMILRRNPRHFKLISVFLVSVTIVPLMLLSGSADGPGLSSQDRHFQLAGFTIVAALMAGILGLVVTSERENGTLKKLMRLRLLRWYGKYSYGIYIFHGMFIFWINDLFRPSRPSPLTGSVLGDFVARPVAGIAISSLMGWISFHLLETRFLRLKDWLAPSRHPML